MKHVTKSSQNNHQNGSKDTAKESNRRGSNRHSSKASQTSQKRSEANITKRRTTESPKSNPQHTNAGKKPVSSSKKTAHSSQNGSSETIDSKTIASKTNVSSKTNTVEGEKLQKVLARSGIGSRREIETMISDGRISVDGKLATLGDRVTVTQNLKIRVDGHVISLKTPEQTICRVIAYYKPEGEICTRNDPEGRPTVYSRLPKIVNGRWIAVGRLDINTSGLLLFTNDGELANRLMHPSNQIEREYSVRVFGEVTDDIKRTVTTSVQLEDGPASFKRMVEAGGEGINKWYNVVLTEGRNREVRRIWEAVDLQVSRLIRIRYGDIQLPNRLPRGGWEELDLTSVNYLRELVQLPSETGTKLNLQKDKKRIKTGQIRRAVQRHTTAASNNRRRRTGL